MDHNFHSHKILPCLSGFLEAPSDRINSFGLIEDDADDRISDCSNELLLVSAREKKLSFNLPHASIH